MAQFGDFADYPTVMWLHQELDVIRSLQKMPLGYLRDNTGAFKDLIEALSYSHSENIGFIRRNNEKEFARFGDWLEGVWEELGVGRGRDVSDIFRTTFDDVANEYPGWEKEATDRDLEDEMLRRALRDLCDTHEILEEVAQSEIYKRGDGVAVEYFIAEVVMRLAKSLPDKQGEVLAVCAGLESLVSSLQTAVAQMARNAIIGALSVSSDAGLALRRLLPSDFLAWIEQDRMLG